MDKSKFGFAAHLSEDGRIQTVKDHLEGTARRTSEYAGAFGAADIGYLTGIMHDIGKYSKGFQDRLFCNGPKVDHSTAGAYECINMGQLWPAFAVAGHHAGLPDMGTRADYANTTLMGRIAKARNGNIPDYSHWKKEINIKKKWSVPSFCLNNPETDAFFGRMLYSCLVDADYLDTENFMLDGNTNRNGGESLDVLYARLERYVSRWYPATTELNKKRCEILDECIKAGELDRGLYTLTVPTGGGKTVASLAFALKHAVKNRLSRIIYVIPYTSIIEQTADVFRSILGEENVLEHHSGVNYSSEDSTDLLFLKLRNASENWDMPIIVTTAVQFFESLFSNRSSKCRKLHNISNSVVVFDEAQMIPIPYLKPCVYTISQLVTNYQVSAVLCTATQPSLGQIFTGLGAQYNPYELCDKKLFKDPVFRRVTFNRKKGMTWDDVAERMNQEDQILCIVNSRKNAQSVFERLEGDGIYHLSTLMTPHSRKKILQEIRQLLKSNKKCRVVSTSLIEAGVDVDFPMVMREENGLDSVLQAAGRCNREGKRSFEKSIVTVFSTADKIPILFAANAASARIVMNDFADFAGSEAISRYYQELYAIKGEKALDIECIMDKLKTRNISYKEIADSFKLIGNDTSTIYIIQDEKSKRLIERRINGEISRELIRELSQYSVNIYEQHMKSLYAAGDISMLNDGSFYLVNESLYNHETGLSLEADWGKAEFI